jgi:hypothetical protein
MFRVGSRVICVDDSIREDNLMFVLCHMPGWVEKGKIYTIREFADNDGIVPGVLLEEISNPPVYVELVNSEIEPRFALFRFRELDEQELSAETEEYAEIEEYAHR